MGWKDGLKKAGRMLVMGEIDVANEMRQHKSLISKGSSSTARCVTFELDWDRDEGDPRWGAAKMTLEVAPPGGGPEYPWSGDIWVRVAQAKLIEPGLNLEGHVLPVKIDSSDPNSLAIDWDSAPEPAATTPAGS
jgi:hypothetical protein